MSRSKRSTPIVGDTTATTEKHDKALAHRRTHSAVRQTFAAGELEIPSLRKTENIWQYDKDGKHWIGDRFPELMRK